MQSGGRDVGCLQTLGALGHLELHTGAFIERPVSLRLDSREVHKDILPVLPLDEAVALGCVEPLHCTFFFHLPLFLLLNLKLTAGTGSRALPHRKKGCGWTHAPLFDCEAENKSQMRLHYTPGERRVSGLEPACRSLRAGPQPRSYTTGCGLRGFLSISPFAARADHPLAGCAVRRIAPRDRQCGAAGERPAYHF